MGYACYCVWLSGRPSVCQWRSVLWLNDTSYTSDVHETETRPRLRRCSCRDLDRDVWYIKIIQHNKIQINWTGKLSKALCSCNIVGFSALRNGKWSMFCCCSFLTGWNLLPVPTAEKKLWREDSEHACTRTVVYSVDFSTSSNHFSLSRRPNWVWSLVIYSDQIMRHNRLSLSRFHLARLEWLFSTTNSLH